MYKSFIILFGLASMLFTPWLSQADASVKLEMPPTSLGQWYKPENKRQVWLHTMFRLRRAMQAIDSYALENNQQGMQKWSKKLNDDYLKIADMVPEWENEIKPRLLPELEMFIDSMDTRRVRATLNMIQRTCNDCHDTYQPLVTAIYRSPEYDDISVKNLHGEMSSFEDEMEALSRSVNRILIALEDKLPTLALRASNDLAGQLDNLGHSCSQCHKNDPAPRERILGSAIKDKIALLQTSIKNQQTKESRKMMGEIGVMVCARCHNTHRILGDLRETLLNQPGDKN